MSSDERESLLQRTGNTEIKVDMKQPSDIESSSETKVTETIAVLQQPRPPTEARYLYFPQQQWFIVTTEEDDYSTLTMCSMIGFIFSWIPIIGFLTFLWNFDAPLGSRRRLYAQMAGAVSSFVILFNLIFWAIYQ